MDKTRRVPKSDQNGRTWVANIIKANHIYSTSSSYSDSGSVDIFNMTDYNELQTLAEYAKEKFTKLHKVYTVIFKSDSLMHLKTKRNTCIKIDCKN